MQKQQLVAIGFVLLAGLVVAGGYGSIKLYSKGTYTKGAKTAVYTTQSYREGEQEKNRNEPAIGEKQQCCAYPNGSTLYDFDDQGDALSYASELCACGSATGFQYISVPTFTGETHLRRWQCVNAIGSPRSGRQYQTSHCEVFEQRCGDGVVTDDETCDDGNPTNGDGCETDCTLSSTEPTGCTVDADCPEDAAGVCTTNVCKEGVCVYYDACQEGQTCLTQGNDEATRPVCFDELPTCGNSIIDSGESCDDGGLVNGDGCDDQCQLEAVCETDNDCAEDAAGVCTTNVCKEGVCMYYDACPEGSTCTIAGTGGSQRVECN